MKVLLSVMSLCFALTAGAARISSVNECRVPLYSASGYVNNFTVDGTRVSGKVALSTISHLKKSGAESSAEIDSLGVKRYTTIVKRSVLDTEGTDVNSCEGVYYALKVETCTVDASVAVCETSCKIEWKGQDCR